MENKVMKAEWDRPFKDGDSGVGDFRREGRAKTFEDAESVKPKKSLFQH